jgi:hypothetical protein
MTEVEQSPTVAPRDQRRDVGRGHNGGPALEVSSELLYTFDQVREALRPMGRNQVYQAFRNGEIPGGKRIGGRWYAVKRKFDKGFGRDSGRAA